MAQSFVLHAVTCAGLVVVSYRSATTLKHRVDVELDAAHEEEEEAGSAAASAAAARPALRPAAAESVASMLLFSPGRKSLVGRRRRYSSAVERLSSAEQQDAAAARLLRFWVLFGTLHLLAGLGVPYAVELRAALAVLGLLRTRDGGPLVDRGFELFARPLMSRHVPRAAHFLLAYAHAVVDALAPLIRSLLALAAFACTPFATTESLLELEAGLARAGAEMEAERAARRRIEAAATAALEARAAGAQAGAAAEEGAAGGEEEDEFRVPSATDFLDADEVASRLLGRAGSSGGAQ